MFLHQLENPCRNATLVLATLLWSASWADMAAACTDCDCQRQDGAAVCTPHSHGTHSHGTGDHSHDIGSHDIGSHDIGSHDIGSHDIGSHDIGQMTAFSSLSGIPSAMSATPLKFAVIGDTQGGESGGHGNLLTRLMESVNTHNVDYVLFPGDLIANTGNSGWNDWKNRTSILGLNSAGVDKRLMTPGNHDVGPSGTFSNWQNTFNWLPNSQALGGQMGIDQVDYFVDQGNVRFVSISTDAPGQSYNSRVVNQAPPALDWMREVMKDVDTRNADANPDNNIDHVFTFSHRPITTQLESPTGGTNGDWWQSMIGQDAQSGDHEATAFFPGHWHMYQPSRPDPRVDTMEIISGTGGGGLEGQAHRNRHGYSIITVDGGNVTSEFYGDFNQDSDNWNFQLLDEYTIAQVGGLPTGELARYQFENGTTDQDSSRSPLSKAHSLNFNGSAQTESVVQQGNVLRTFGDGNSYVDAKDIGDNNLAVLNDLTISLFAKADRLSAVSGDNTLVAFGGAHGSSNSSLGGQESANHAYKLSLTAEGNLQMAWQHDDATWETVTSTAAVADPTEWHEYVVQRDGDNRGVGFFVDGEQLGQVFAADFLPTGAGSGSLYIGSGMGGGDDFDGWIDDVRIDSSDVSLVPMLLGDFNSDGVIDGADWTIYMAGLGSATPGATDLTGDGLNDHSDFLQFKRIFEDFNGSGAFESMLAVPEPASLVLLGLGSFSIVCSRRRALL